MTQAISPDLFRGLRKWLEEATSAKPGDYVKSYGLCNYMEAYGEASWELGRLFRAEGRCDAYPFGGGDQYGHRMARHTQHLNPERRAWVRHMLGVPTPA